MRVGVSDGVWPDVFSGVRVHVRDLEEKAILSSASLRLTGNMSRNTDSPYGTNTHKHTMADRGKRATAQKTLPL